MTRYEVVIELGPDPCMNDGPEARGQAWRWYLRDTVLGGWSAISTDFYATKIKCGQVAFRIFGERWPIVDARGERFMEKRAKRKIEGKLAGTRLPPARG